MGFCVNRGQVNGPKVMSNRCGDFRGTCVSTSRWCQDELLTLLIDLARELHEAMVCSHDENFEAVGLWQGRRALLLLTNFWHFAACLIKILVLFFDVQRLVFFSLLYQPILLLCDKICGTLPFCDFVGALVRPPQLTETAS